MKFELVRIFNIILHVIFISFCEVRVRMMIIIIIMIDSDEFSDSSFLYNIRLFNENLKLNNIYLYTNSFLYKC